MNMTYSEAMNGAAITKGQVIKELKKHGFTFEEFSREMGDEPTYDSTEVLIWMGY